MKEELKIVITCGGTGGHFYPGLTIANEIKKQNNDILIVLSGRNIESQSKIVNQNGINYKVFLAPSLPKKIRDIFLFPFKLLKGFLEMRKILKDYKPDAILGMGSFASIPSSLAAVSLKIPLFLHDGNSYAGKANTFLSRFAKCFFASYPLKNKDKCKCDIIMTGMPVRDSLLNQQISKIDAIEKINKQYNASLNKNTITFFIFGGSQGAKFFNDYLPNLFNKLNNDKIQIIHLTGKNNKERVQELYNNGNINNLILEYSTEMEILYSASDFIISRSGGSSLAEIAIFKKFAFFIPYPFAAEQHQKINAEYFEKSGVAEIIDEKDYSEDILIEKINKRIDNIKNMSLNFAEIAKPNATKDIVLNIVKLRNSQK